MKTWISMLQGINLGSHNKISLPELVAARGHQLLY